MQILPAPERPIDLFKAIFEADVDGDGSEDEAEEPVAPAVIKSELSSANGSGGAAFGTKIPTGPGEKPQKTFTELQDCTVACHCGIRSAGRLKAS